MFKRSILFSSVCMLVLIFTVHPANALDLFGSDDSGKVNVDALTASSADVMKKVRKATIAFAEAVINVQNAVGKKESAEKLKTSLDNLKSNPDDPNKVKVCVADLNNAVTELNDVDMQSQCEKSQAQSFLANSILNVGAGILMDSLASAKASALLKDSQAALKKVSFLSAGKVKNVITTSQFIVTEVPPQANSMQTFSTKMITYAKTNGLSVSNNKADIEKKKQEMEKE